MGLDDIRRKYDAALLEIEELKNEIHSLKLQMKLLSPAMEANPAIQEAKSLYAETATPLPQAPVPVHQHSKVEEKLALYRSLFRGREDVYPVRWFGKQGKSGYSPVCGNEWTSVCQKPQVKCSVCTHQKFLPITDKDVSMHLDAREDRTIGVYPMLKDETCWFLAMDFDKKNWQEDASAVMQICKEKGIPTALERSRSGNGGHIWIFFSEPIPAGLARKLGTILLSLTMKQRYQIGLDSYDRLFPNQDTLPKGGFGNLIALPLQGGPRKNGNSTFVDENFIPFEDQWRFLSGLGKMSMEEVSRFIQIHRMEDQYGTDLVGSSEDEDQPCNSNTISSLEPSKEPLPPEVSVILSDRLYIAKKDLSPSTINKFMRIASFSNPDFYKTQAMRLSTYGKPRVISCAEDLSHHIALPRGCYTAVTDFIVQNDAAIQLEDKRFNGIPFEVQFNGELTTLQDAAARVILANDLGILSAATGFGKTIVAASIIAKRKVNTLILVHRRELLDQWKERLETFLDVPKGFIGVVGGGKDKRTGIVDIAVIQSLNYKGNVKEYISEYGQIIVDECHHVSAFSFEQVLMKAKAKFVFGLTATPKRQDGQEAIVTMQLGPIRMKIDTKMLGSSRGFALTVVPRYTTFQMPVVSTINPSIQDVYQALVLDEERNTMIFDDLLKCLEDGRSPLLLVERTAHAEYFEQRLRKFAKNVIVLRGGMSKKQRDAVRAQIACTPDDEERVFIATGKLIGEGFDDARLDTLFLVHPISWSGTLQQYAGRLHRTHVNKKEVKIYDYIDLLVPVLMSMYKKRVKGYRKMGYRGADL